MFLQLGTFDIGLFVKYVKGAARWAAIRFLSNMQTLEVGTQNALNCC